MNDLAVHLDGLAVSDDFNMLPGNSDAKLPHTQSLSIKYMVAHQLNPGKNLMQNGGDHNTRCVDKYKEGTDL